MTPIPRLRVVLDLDPLSEPIRGRVVAERDGDGDARAFSGWMELSSLIERIRAAADTDTDTGDAADVGEPDLSRGG